MNDIERINSLPPISKVDHDSNVLDVSLKNAAETNPDKEREYLDISTEFDIPMPFVRENYDSVKSMVTAKQSDPKKFVASYPSTASWFMSQENANLSSDSIDQLQQYEKIMRSVRSEKEIDAAGGRLGWAARAIGERSAALAGNLLKISGKYIRMKQDATDVTRLLPESQMMSDMREMSQAPADYLTQSGSDLSQLDLGTPNVDAWSGFKDDWTNPQALADFLVSQSGSVVDMVGAAFALPAYIASRTEEIATERAELSDQESPEATDYGIGVTTAVITSLIERLGAKFVLGSFLDDSARLSKASQVPGSVGKATAVEAGTEFVQEQVEYLGETAFTNKELSLLESFDRGMAGMVGGAGMGATIRGATGSYEVATDARYKAKINAELDRQASEFKAKADDSVNARGGAKAIQEAVEELRKAAATARGADIQSLSQSIVDNGGPQELSFDAQAIVDAANKVGLDVGDLSLQLFGSRDALGNSAKAQTAVTVPVASYMSSDLALKAHEDIASTMLVDNNNMTLDDAKEFDNAVAQQLIDGFQTVNDEMAQDDSMVNDVYRQLRSAGHTESYAQSASALYRFMVVMRERGVSEEFLRQFDLSIGREVPESLQAHVKNSEFDAMLDDLRNGRIPSPDEYMGQNLLDFVIEQGGVLPDSDLDAMDADVGRVGRNRITRLTGVEPDYMAELAFDAGYIAEPDLDLFMDAIDQSVQGGKVYSDAKADQETKARAEDLERLGVDLEAAEIDVQALSNEEIYRLLMSPDGEQLAQAAQDSDLYNAIVAEMYKSTDSFIVDGEFDQAAYNLAVSATEDSIPESVWSDWRNGNWIDSVSAYLSPEDRASLIEKYNGSVVYHGTPDDEFEQVGFESAGGSKFVTTDEQEADHYAGEGGRVIEETLQVSNPLFVESSDITNDIDSNQSTINEVRAAGYDSIIPAGGGAILVLGDPQTQTLYQSDADLTSSEQFIEWAGTNQVIDSDDINDEDFSGGGPFVLRAYHGTTNQFDVFDASVKGTKEGQFDAVNYFTSSEYDADQNYAGAGPDLTIRIERRAEQLEYNEGMDPDEAKEQAKKELHGGDEIVHEVFIRTDKPFVVGDNSPWLEFFDESELEAAAIEIVASNNDVTIEEVQSNKEDYEDDIEDARWEARGEQENPLFSAIETVAYRYDVDPSEILSSMYDVGADGEVNHQALEEALRENEQLGYSEDPETGEFISSHMIGEIIQELGFDSIILRDANQRFESMDMLDGTAHIHVFDQNNTNIKSTENAGTFDARDPNIYRQGGRGSIEMDRDAKKYRINLTEKSDLSTFLHESGHFFFEVMTDAYNAGEGGDLLRADYEALINHLGGTAGEQLTTTQLESFAEMFEQYLREGKAPAQELQSAFQSFKIWLTNIYKNIKAIFAAGDRELNDDVREIMDRMLATDQEIAAANDGLNLDALFEAKPEWFTDDMWLQYQQDQAARKEAQENNLNNQKINEVKRANQEWWRNELKRTEAEVSEETDSMPVYQLLALLRSKEPKTPQGEPLEGVVHYSLDKQATVNLMGDVFVNGGKDAAGNEIKPALPSSVYRVKGRAPIPPQALFDTFPGEFESAFDMLQVMAAAPDRNRYVKDESKRRMNDRHGSVNANQADAYIGAVDAAHDEKVTVAMVGEINSLAPATGGYTVTRDAFKRSAQIILSGLQLRAIKPNNYRRAEIKHGNAAMKAVAAGDLALAKRERELQLLNFYLYNQSKTIKQKEEQGYQYARSMSKGARVKTLQKAGDHYLDQMAAILNQYEFKKMSNKQLHKRKRMQEWINETLAQAGAGNPTVDDGVATDGDKELVDQQSAEDSQGGKPDFESQVEEVINYRELNPVEFAEVINMIESVYKLAQLKNKLMTSKDKRTFEQAKDDLIESIKAAGGDKTLSPEYQRTRGERLKDDVLLSSRTPASIIRELDQFKDGGVAFDLILRPIQEGEAESAERMRKAKDDMLAIWKDSYTNKEISQMQSKRADPVTGGTYSRYDVLSFLLNWGNETNRDRVMTGHSINEAQVNHLFNTYLTKQDVEFANKMWAYLDTYWQSTSDLHKDFYGYTPDKVTSMPFDTNHGQLTGGYYPIVYSSTHSARAEQNQAKNMLERFSAGVGKKIQMGSTKKRTKGGLGRPLLLDVNQVTTGHVFDTIRRTSMDRAIFDAGRLISSDGVKAAIIANFGEAKYKAVKDSILVSRDGIQETKTGLEQYINSIRNNASAAMLGWSLRTIVLQPFGVTNSIARLRMSGVGRGKLLNTYAKYMANPAGTMGTIRKKSTYMRNREETQNAEIARLSKQMELNVTAGRIIKAKDFISQKGMIPMMKVQMYTVDVPTWLAAYESFKVSFDDDKAVSMADQFVRDAQGGGDTMDIAKSMNGGAFLKVFTNFLSYMMTTYNLQVQAVKQTNFKEVGDVMRLAENTILLMMIPAVLTAMLNAFASGDWPDDAEEITDAYLKEQVSFLAGMSPITGQFSGAAAGFDYSGPQGLTIISKLYNTINGITSDIEKEKAISEMVQSDRNIKNGIWVVGLATGLPAAQVNRSIWGAKQAIENNEPEAQTVKQALFGKEYDR